MRGTKPDMIMARAVKTGAFACSCLAAAVVIGIDAPRVQARAQRTTASQAPTVSGAASTNPARELVSRYCIGCHNEKLKSGGLILDKADAANVSRSAETWEKVAVKLRGRAMPPPGRPRPDAATYDAVASWLEAELDRAA